MNPQITQSSTVEHDRLINDVRQIRRKICERNDHDLDRLFQGLREVARQYSDISICVQVCQAVAPIAAPCRILDTD